LNTILNKQQFDLTIKRLAHQVLENHDSIRDIAFIGIQTGGAYVSDQLIALIRELHPDDKINYGKLDITFYRDDVRNELHIANQTDIGFSIEGKTVILVDDVLYTGRTIRAALDALQDFGRPEKVELCVLIDRRFNRQLPIQPDYCGKAIDTTSAQKVKVERTGGEVIIY
jgi:pyrimidine operon attenuation protein/uracil phosphoribosyltransferase